VKKINAFTFIIHYLGFLKHVPLLPLLFDLHLKVWTGLTNRAILRSIESIENEVSKWPGVYSTTHKYGGLQFNYAGREIGHIHGNGLLDIRFTRAIKQQLMTDHRIADHHSFNNSGWISFYINGEKDGKYAIELLRQSYSRLSKGFTPPVSLAAYPA